MRQGIEYGYGRGLDLIREIEAYAETHGVTRSVAADRVILSNAAISEHHQLEKCERALRDREFASAVSYGQFAKIGSDSYPGPSKQDVESANEVLDRLARAFQKDGLPRAEAVAKASVHPDFSAAHRRERMATFA